MYQSIDHWLHFIDVPWRPACQQILREHRALFETTPGSTNNHQTWPGGYIDLITDLMNIAHELYQTLRIHRPLPFTLSDSLLVLFLHDIEKPWKYELRGDGQLHHVAGMETKEKQHAWRMAFLQRYGIELTSAQLNALKYVEGELSDYSPRHRVMNELAAFCHMCDVCSARIFPQYPVAERDPWPGAQRFRKATT